MNNFFLQIKQGILSLLLLIIFASNSNAQALTGSKTIPSTFFPSIKVAVDSLNAQGVGLGGVIFDIAAGYTETISATIAVTATGTAVNPIVFRKDPSTTGANPLITAYTGTLLASSTTTIDVMWSFSGSDFVTINAIDLQENVLNTTPTTQMEVGYGFYKASATDGANNNLIQNCTITLNRNNNTASTGPRLNASGSVGIELMACTPTAVGTTITVTSVAGASSNNKFYSNTIQNVNFGISLGGFAAASPYTLADLNNDIGGNSLTTGNNIINFGGGIGATSQCGAVYIHNQWSFNISYNTVNNNNGSGLNHPVSNRGIWLFNSSAGASCNINFNKITINGGSNTGSIDWCIDLEMATTGANGNIINLNNNQFLNCNKMVASTQPFTAFWINTAATTVNCNNNYIYGFSYAGTGTSDVIFNQLAGIGTLNITNNIIDSTVLSGTAASGTHRNIGLISAPASALNINGNTITRTILNTSGIGSKILYPIYFSAATPNINVNDNLVDSVTRNGTTGGTTIGIYHVGGSNGTTTVNCRRNTVRNMSISGTGTGSTMYGIQLGTGTIICDSNTVFNLSCLKTTGTGAMYGIYDFSSPNVETYSNNKIYNLTHSGTGLVYGIYTFTTTGTRLVNNNSIYSLTGNGGNVIGLLMSSSSPTITRNKIYSLRSNGTTTGTVFGISITSLGTAGFANIANNLIDSLVAPNYSGTTDAIRGISSINTTATTNLRIYYNTIRLSALTGGANFSSASIFFTGGTTSTTSTLDLRNNIIINNSFANGTGNAVALRNSTTGISNYANTSNNNLFFAGTPSATNLIYNDGTNSDQTIAAFKTRLATFEQASFTENPTFISFTGSSPDFLHLDLSTPTRCESGAVNIAGYNTDYDNVIRQGNIGYTGTGSLPDVGADEGEFTGIVMILDSSNVDQITAATPINTSNQHVVAIRVHTSNSFNALNLTSFKLNTAGTSNVNDIQNAKVYFTGNSATFSPTNQFGSTILAPNGNFYINGSRTLVAGVNYFWVTYDVKSTATANNFIDVRVDSLVIAGSNTAPLNGDPSGARKISAPLAGNYNIGVGQTYVTITSAIEDLKALGVSGSVTFTLKDALYNTTSGEIFPIVFGNYLGSSATNTVIIRPDLGNISRVESANPIATFDLNGISNLTIDGRQGGTGSFISGNNLIIANTNAAGPAIRFINEASTNKILYADLRSNNIIAPGTIGAGVVNFGTTNGLNGNDNNIIRYCDIHEDGIGNPTIGVSSIGSVTSIATNNDNNSIDSCNIYNFFHPTIATAGIYVGANNSSWIINANNFYQTATVTTTGTQTHRVMWITPNTASLTSASGFVITNNFIGGNASNRTGTFTMNGTTGYQFFGMDISVGLGTTTLVQNNTITNFSYTSGFAGNGTYGINIANGNVNIFSNLIGSTTTNGAITFTTTVANGSLIALRSGAGGTINFSNNIVSGIDLISNNTTLFAGFNGIAASGGLNIIINNNTVGSSTLANSINMVSTSATATVASAFRGIICNSGTVGAVNTITNNIVANLNSNYSATGAQGTTLVGIAVTTGASTVTGNTIINLTSATQTTTGGSTSAILGILYTSVTAPAVISNNKINNFVLTGISSTAAVQCEGLFYSGPTTGVNVISKNTIHSLSLNAVNPNVYLTAMDIAAGLVTISNNMIRLGYDSLGISITTPCFIRGISKNVAITNVFFNSIYIGGTGVGTNATNTFAFQRTASAVSDNVRNNIFMNDRSNASTGGKHYQCFLINNTTINLNNNIYFGSGTGAVFGTLNNGTSDILTYSAGWTASDLNSGAANPQFINATGAASLGDLHINTSTPSPIESSGVLITTITDDFDGQIRSNFSATDIGADAGNFLPQDIFAPVIANPNTSNSSSTADRILNINITDFTGVPTTSSNEPRIYFKKSFAGSYSSTSAVRTSGTAQNGQWSFTISQSSMGGLTLGDSVYYYIVAQDSSLANNLSSLPAGAIGTSVNTISTPPNTLFSYKIVAGISGNVYVGVGQTYTSLTNVGGFFEAVNNGSLNGNVTAFITSDLLEDGTNGINPINETGAGNYTLTIVPDSSSEKLIAGSFAGGLIRFNGADRVKIDGRFAGSGRYLRFRNRLQNGYTINFQNDAVRDTITFCHIESVNNTVGTITFLGTNIAGGIGNDSNAITNCIIRDTLGTISTSNIPNTGFFSQGTTGFGNDRNSIINNEIYNFGFNGVNLSTTSGDFWNISNNSFYQNITKNQAMIIMQIDGGTGHNFTGNNFGGSNAVRGGTPFTTTSSINIFRINNAITTAQISNNTFSNIASIGTVNAILVSAGVVNINSNIFGGAAQPYDTIQNGFDNGIINISGGTVNVTNNLIGNVNYYDNAGDRTVGVAISGGTVVARGNTIRDIRSNSSSTSLLYLPTGFYITGGANHDIDSNIIYNIASTNTGSIAYNAAGIIHNGGTNNIIQRNRIYNVWGSGTGTATNSNQVYGIYNSSTVGSIVRNNQISIGNNTIGETRVYGIQDVAGSGTNSYYNNSIFVNGTTLGGSNNSYCLQRTGLVNINSFNNVFFNKRTSTGTGSNYATGSNSLTGITPLSTNYNLYVVNDTAKIAESPTGFANSISVFNSLYNGANTYSSNWYEFTANIAPQTLFADTLVGNLGIVTTNANCWYVHGKGLALVSVANDFNNTPRSVSIATGATDIGAFEFTTTTTPIAASASAAPAINTTTNYTFANRQVASINWGSVGTVPSAVNVLYYSGINAPNLISNSSRYNSYYNITATGGSAFNYGISLIADSAQYGTVSGINNTRIARYTGSNWNLITASNPNAITGTIQTATNTQNVFGVFTGTDNLTNPLPVKFKSLFANKYAEDVILTWNTASEVNNKGFEVERSIDGKTFELIGFVKGNGNSNKSQNYQYVDAVAFKSFNTSVLYYRLKQVDYDGNFFYSTIVSVNNNDANANSVSIYPNPFTNELNISIIADNNNVVNIETMDIQGKLVANKSISVVKGVNVVSMNENSSLHTGIYFVRIAINGEIKTVKLVKN
jgi:hypothetical protein